MILEGALVLGIYFFYIIVLLMYPIYRYYLGVRGLVTLLLVTLSALLLILLQSFSSIVFCEQVYYCEFTATGYSLATIELTLSFALNQISYFFFLLVTVIGVATNIYTLNYFKNEADEGLFLFWLNSFIASMSLLILGNNFFTLFLGWELIGLTSFFLINFWVARRATLKSSIKAFTFNLVSDMALLTSIVFLYLNFGVTDLNFLIMLGELTVVNYTTYLVISIFALLVCTGIKSVQLFGHLWLPDSMEAPVPASALIHSATLVSAGVYLLLKFFNLFIITDLTFLILLSGAVTCAYGGVVAAVQTDMKKLLAYSTMSHCGFLYVTIYFGFFFITILYLFLHGLFKAATFYCVGSFVRVYKSQDIRLMGSGGSVMPLDIILLIFCAINLGGLPFTVGYIYKVFFFKTLCLTKISYLSFGFIIIGLLTSVIYVIRIIYYSSFEYLKGPQFYLLKNLQTVNFNLTLFSSAYTPLTIYAVFTLFLVSFFVYYFAYYILQESYVEFNSLYLTLSSFTKLVYYFSLLYTPYFLFFYFLYFFIISSFNVVEMRFKFTKINSYFIIINSIILILSINIVSIIFICEVRL